LYAGRRGDDACPRGGDKPPVSRRDCTAPVKGRRHGHSRAALVRGRRKRQSVSMAFDRPDAPALEEAVEWHGRAGRVSTASSAKWSSVMLEFVAALSTLGLFILEVVKFFWEKGETRRRIKISLRRIRR